MHFKTWNIMEPAREDNIRPLSEVNTDVYFQGLVSTYNVWEVENAIFPSEVYL